MKITVPIATRGGNQLLLLRDFLTDQVPTPRGLVWGGDKQTARCALESPDPSSFPGPRAGWAFLGQRGERTVRAAESARAGVRLVACFLVQVNTSCNIWGNSTEYRRAPTEEDLSRTPQLVSVPMPGAPGRGEGLPELLDQ